MTYEHLTFVKVNALKMFDVFRFKIYLMTLDFSHLPWISIFALL